MRLPLSSRVDPNPTKKPVITGSGFKFQNKTILSPPNRTEVKCHCVSLSKVLSSSSYLVGEFEISGRHSDNVRSRVAVSRSPDAEAGRHRQAGNLWARPRPAWPRAERPPRDGPWGMTSRLRLSLPCQCNPGIGKRGCVMSVQRYQAPPRHGFVGIYTLLSMLNLYQMETVILCTGENRNTTLQFSSQNWHNGRSSSSLSLHFAMSRFVGCVEA